MVIMKLSVKEENLTNSLYLQFFFEFENLPRATSISSFFTAVCLLVDLGVPDPAV